MAFPRPAIQTRDDPAALFLTENLRATSNRCPHYVLKESVMRDREAENSALSDRVRIVRTVLFGERGGPILARRLRVPQRTLARMEEGRPIAGELILKLIEVTGANPHWLLYGEGEKFAKPARRLVGGRCFGPRSTE
jgi:hypothetical protein